VIVAIGGLTGLALASLALFVVGRSIRLPAFSC
jgi:hypothetical protein